MSVVVNEFEVIPGGQEQAPPAPAAAEAPEVPPVSVPAEVERVVLSRAERALRVEAD